VVRRLVERAEGLIEGEEGDRAEERLDESDLLAMAF
jgi:hypothetical protein